MAVQYPQKLMYFLSSLGCFRTALAIAANTANMKIMELLQHSVQCSLGPLWPYIDVLFHLASLCCIRVLHPVFMF